MSTSSALLVGVIALTILLALLGLRALPKAPPPRGPRPGLTAMQRLILEQVLRAAPETEEFRRTGRGALGITREVVLLTASGHLERRNGWLHITARGREALG